METYHNNAKDIKLETTKNIVKIPRNIYEDNVLKQLFNIFLEKSKIEEHSGYYIKIGNYKFQTIYEEHNAFEPIKNKIINRYLLFDQERRDILTINHYDTLKNFLFTIPLKYLPIEIRLYFQFVTCSIIWELLERHDNLKDDPTNDNYVIFLRDMTHNLSNCENISGFINEAIKYIYSFEEINKPPKTCLTPVITYNMTLVKDLNEYLNDTLEYETFFNLYSGYFSNYMLSSYYNLNIGDIFKTFNKIASYKGTGYHYIYFKACSKYGKLYNFFKYLQFIGYKPSINKFSSLIRKPKLTDYNNNIILFRTERGELLKLTKKDVNLFFSNSNRLFGTFIKT